MSRILKSLVSGLIFLALFFLPVNFNTVEAAHGGGHGGGKHGGGHGGGKHGGGHGGGKHKHGGHHGGKHGGGHHGGKHGGKHGGHHGGKHGGHHGGHHGSYWNNNAYYGVYGFGYPGYVGGSGYYDPLYRSYDIGTDYPYSQYYYDPNTGLYYQVR